MSTFATQRTAILGTARSIVDQAKAAHRELTSAEADQVSAAIAEVETLDAKIKSVNLARSVMALGGVDREGGGNVFSDSAKAGIATAVKSRTAHRTELNAKALLTTGTMLAPSESGVEGGLHPNSQFPLASLFPNQSAEEPVQRYYRMGSGTAAIVAEGGLKPDAGTTIIAVDLALFKLAATAVFSDEMQEDAGYLVDWIGLEPAPPSPPPRSSSSSTPSAGPPASSPPPEH